MKYPRRRHKRKAKVPKSVAKYVKKAIDKSIEDKFNYVTGTTDISNLASYFICNQLSQGTTIANRIGEKIKCKELQMKFQLSHTATTGVNTYQRVRIMVFYDRQCNGALPSDTQMWMTPTAGSTYSSLFNPAGYPRYRVIYDKQIDLNTQGGSTNIGQAKHVFKKIKLNTITTYNTGNAGTIADINTNSLIIYVISANTATGGVGASMFYEILFKYEDA